MDKIVTFEEAVEHPEKRQRYLATLDLEWARNYVYRVIYKNYDEIRSDGRATFMDCCRPLSGRMLPLRGIRSNIRVYPAAFDCHEYEDDFKSTLIDHEGQHAKDFYEHPRTFGLMIGRHLRLAWNDENELFNRRMINLLERRATMNQLRKVNQEERDVSIDYDIYLLMKLIEEKGERDKLCEERHIVQEMPGSAFDRWLAEKTRILLHTQASIEEMMNKA